MTDEQVIKEVGKVFQQAADYTVARRFSNITEVATFTTGSLIDLIAQLQHPGDIKAQTKFVEACQQEVGKATKRM